VAALHNARSKQNDHNTLSAVLKLLNSLSIEVNYGLELYQSLYTDQEFTVESEQLKQSENESHNLFLSL
jgi:hypothetical protein